MVVYPLLNFVLPLMLSSFVLVNKPANCSDCQIKKGHKIVVNAKIESLQDIDAEVSSLKSSAVIDGEFLESNVH